jgi:enoyl-[acyl-carrier protein] reductase II
VHGVRTRITDLLGIEYPIVQAPMGYIARAQLASAVSNAGGLGIIETSSGDLPAVREEIAKMRDLTEKPFGVNIAQLFVRDPSIVDFVVDNGVRFVTTSAGDPTRYTALLKDAGLVVFHVVPTLRGAKKAVDAGVDGLVVEGNEGGGFKDSHGASTMVLLPHVTAHVDVPVIAAGGICDGRSMAAAFVLGAEGVQMGTRMVSAAESPVHQAYKQLIVESPETATMLLNRFARPAFRVLHTPHSEALEPQDPVPLGELGGQLSLYFDGNLDAGLAFGGQVAGRIDAVKPVADILRETMREFDDVMADMARRFPAGEPAGVE